MSGSIGDNPYRASGVIAAAAGGGGAITWETTANTTGFTADSGSGYLVDTSGGAFTATLPASPDVGDQVAFIDFAVTFDTNNLTLGRNSLNINSDASNGVITQERGAVHLIYASVAQGWITSSQGQSATANPIGTFVAATGGDSTATVDTDYKVHTFTGDGTFTVTSAGDAFGSNSVDYLVIAGGGGGGGSGNPGYTAGGGGGAGGYRVSNTTSQSFAPNQASTTAISVSASPGAYAITVGGGGSAGPATGNGGAGSNSSFDSDIVSTGGGYGAYRGGPTSGSGGSGGGMGENAGTKTIGTGNSGGFTPSEGTAGSSATQGVTPHWGGGGGGSRLSSQSGRPWGGDGASNAIDGTETFYAGGGGGGAYPDAYGGKGGVGGGGPGGLPGAVGTAGTTNTGGGGGGGSATGGASAGGAGGSGIVKVRYRFQRTT